MEASPGPSPGRAGALLTEHALVSPFSIYKTHRKCAWNRRGDQFKTHFQLQGRPFYEMSWKQGNIVMLLDTGIRKERR